MSIVSKTDPKGVDNVIDAIQQYIYPSLLGLGWTEYECYPRANKNIKGENLIPEVSKDAKDYIEVLFDDKFNATSFFLPSDTVTINNEERLIVQEIDLIFQVNLKNLYPLITDHRADEEMHAEITQLLTENEELFVDVDGYVIGVDNVYSGLRLRNYSRNGVNLDDMSEFHVVRFTFTVTYDLDDCNIVYSPVCNPASISINGVSFVVVPSGGSENIEVRDGANALVGFKDGSVWRVSTAGGLPVGNSMNGDVLDPAVAGTFKTFVITQADLSPVVVTETSDSPTAFVGTVPNSISTDVYYCRPYLITNGISYENYDTQWRINNGANDYTEAIPLGAPVQVVLPDTVNGRIDYLKYFNIWGHKFRYTGINGGHYDEADGLYYDKDGVLSDKATEFPVYSTTFYFIIDHLTGFRLLSNRLLNKTWALYCSEAPTINEGGFTDWMTVSDIESQAVFNQKSVNLNLNGVARPPFNYSSSLFWTGTTRIGSTTRVFYYQGIDGGDILNTPKTGTQRTSYIAVHLTTPVPQP